MPRTLRNGHHKGVPATIVLNVNGRSASVTVDDLAMPVLYALRDSLGLKGPRFGCGLSQRGACTVHIDGKAVRSCVMPVSAVGNGMIVTFGRSRVTSVDWATYPILTLPEIPDVDIELIDRPTEKPWGAGEPAAAVVPAAIANAVFDAVGARLRSVPFTPAKVVAAIHRA